jgi:hypothetical protein
MKKAFTYQEVKRLLCLVEKGTPIRQIPDYFKDRTPQSIFGKLHRMGVYEMDRHLHYKRTIPAFARTELDPDLPPVNMKEILNKFRSVPRPKTCQFPYGTPGTASFRMCGEPVVRPYSYCLPHKEECTRPRGGQYENEVIEEEQDE